MTYLDLKCVGDIHCYGSTIINIKIISVDEDNSYHLSCFGNNTCFRCFNVSKSYSQQQLQACCDITFRSDPNV